MAQVIIERLSAQFGEDIVETSSEFGDTCVELRSSALLQVGAFLKSDPAMLFDMPIDCTAVDYLNSHKVRFAVVWHLYSTQHKHRVRLRVRVPDSAPETDSLTPLWPGMNWHEREAWDLYGVVFHGHPNLRRILMYEEFKGHPLRKDYPVDGRQPLVEMRPVRGVPTQRRPPPEMLNRP